MKLCISVVVDKNYEKYIPYFIYFITESYPNYYIKILFLDKLNKKTKDLITLIDSPLVSIEENFFKGFPNTNQELKSIRWLVPYEVFEEYDYVYIGDVDILICEEKINLLDIHISHMEKNNIPYSNAIRNKQKRFTGLHFFKVKEYYEYMSKVIEKYSNKIKNKQLRLTQNYRNEHLLYDMINEGVKKLPKDEHRIDINGSGPHHGLHLGIWRGYKDNVKKAVKEQIFKDGYQSHYEIFKKIENNDIYKNISEIYQLNEINYMKKFFKLWK
jgi:hypothetical protein